MVGVVSGAASPVLLIAGWTVAAMLQLPSFSQVADTVSALAAVGATDRWVMTLVFVVVGVCDVVTAAALRPATRAGRLVLIAGAGSGMLVAAFLSIPGWFGPAHAVGIARVRRTGGMAWRAAVARRCRGRCGRLAVPVRSPPSSSCCWPGSPRS